MPTIDLEVIGSRKASKTAPSEEEQVKQKIELAKVQIANDQKAYDELVSAFIAGVENLPTYASFAKALQKSCEKIPNELIDLLLKRSTRDFSPEMKQMRAMLFADIIQRMEQK